MVVVVYQKFLDNLPCFRILRNHLLETCALFLREIEFHVTRYFLKLVQEFLLGSTQNVVDFVDLVELVGSWEEWS